MSLIHMKNISLSFGGPAILDNINLVINPGERVCLTGRNGEGKSSLIRIICGDLEPDTGELARRQGLRTGLLRQDVPGELPGTVFDVIAGGTGETGRLISEYNSLSARLADKNNLVLMRRMGEIQHRLETGDGWQIEQKIGSVISRLDLSGQAQFATLSAGLKRRVLLARALVGHPDLLLLDEPTNHLDIDSISWMQDFLGRYEGTLLFVTHDRMFLRHLATRILELDRGRLTSRPGNYDHYLQHKASELAAEENRRAVFDRKLAREEIWIRQGIKARRTRNEGRVRALEEMRRKRRMRRERPGKVHMSISNAGSSGKIVCESIGAAFSFSDNRVITDFSAIILRGDKVGIIGPNGAGKTTLIRLLLGNLKPRSGVVRLGTGLEVAYFDQLRGQLDPGKSVFDNIADGSDKVTIAGRTRHVYGYLQDFLFAPERARSPVGSLSGGERNRLLLAKMFTRPSNLLVFDEPTNDLDIETLELLEELLLQYDGTVLLVSHDRAFLNNVVTSTFVFEGGGRVAEYVGGYDDWVRQAPQTKPPDPKPRTIPAKKPGVPRRKLKLSYKEQRELEALPARIEHLEDEQQSLYALLSDPAFYKENGADVTRAKARLEIIEEEVPLLYDRWQQLEEIQG